MAKPSTYWDKRAIRRLTDAEKQSEVYIKRIQKIYERANRNIQRDIDTIYRNYAKDTGLDVQSLKTLLTKSETQKLWQELQAKGLDKYVKGNYKARISRLEKLQAQVYAKAKEIYPEEQLEQTMHYRGVINDSYYKTIYDTQMGTGLDFAFSKLDDNMVTTLLNERWSGKNYSQRIWGNTDILAESLSEVIGGALLSGQSIAKTSKQVRERFNVGKYYAERLVRTETNHFNNEADAMAYEEMDVDKYVFLATLDTRTSTICQSLDNKVFDLKDRQTGVNYPPMHPNCRSKTRAYMGEEIEKTLKRRARNPITNENEIIENISYKEWAEKHGLDKSQTPKTTKINLKTAQPKTIIKDKPILTMSQTVDKAKQMAKNPKYASVKTMQDIRSTTKNILGYDGLPKVVTPTEFETLSKNNTVLYRGVHASDTKTANEIVEEFKTGALWTGNTGQAVFGNGVYFTATESLATGEYAGNGGAVIEALLDKSSKIADYQTINKEFYETGIPKIMGLPKEDYQMIIRDVGQYAAVKGYDAIALNGYQGHDYVILLNRTKCIIKGL
jgi:SPP1 gp7 family putative phage head morphogenesis protein